MKIIGLIPIRNGEVYINRWFYKNQNLVDGFIILDDNSTDDTLLSIKSIPNILEIIKSEKTDGFFNDAYNRNILLNSAKKYNPDYIFWIDVDEEWVDFLNIRKILEQNNLINLYLPLIHMYDDETKYIKTYPNSHNGIQWKCRIVKFSEYEQFYFSENNELHFSLNPNKIYIKFYPMLIKHYGHFTEEMRIRKFEFYSKNDRKKLQNYHHIVYKNHKFGNTDDIVDWIKSLNYNWG